MTDELKTALAARAERGRSGDPGEIFTAALVAAHRRRRARRVAVAAALILAVMGTTAALVDRDGGSRLAVGWVPSTASDRPVRPDPVSGLIFDPPRAPAGATVSVQVAGIVGRPNGDFAVWLLYPNLAAHEAGKGLGAPLIGLARVDPAGRLVADIYIPNAKQHFDGPGLGVGSAQPLAPGSYDVLIGPKEKEMEIGRQTVLSPDGTLTAKLEVVRAEVGVPYRYGQFISCLGYLQFDARVWVPLTAPAKEDPPRDWQPRVRGTITLTDEHHAVRAADSGSQVHYRSASSEQESEFRSRCFGTGTPQVPARTLPRVVRRL